MSAFRVPLAARPSRHLPNPGSSKAFSRCCGGREQDDVILSGEPSEGQRPAVARARDSPGSTGAPDARRRPRRGAAPDLRRGLGRALAAACSVPMAEPASSRYRNRSGSLGRGQLRARLVCHGQRAAGAAAERPTGAPARRAALHRPLPGHLDLRRRSRSALDRRCAVDGCSFTSPGRWGSRTSKEPHDDFAGRFAIIAACFRALPS